MFRDGVSAVVVLPHGVDRAPGVWFCAAGLCMDKLDTRLGGRVGKPRRSSAHANIRRGHAMAAERQAVIAEILEQQRALEGALLPDHHP